MANCNRVLRIERELVDLCGPMELKWNTAASKVKRNETGLQFRIRGVAKTGAPVRIRDSG